MAKVVVIGQAPDYSYATLPPGTFLPATAAAMNPGRYRVVLADRRERLAAHPLDAQIRDLGLPALAILGGRDRMYPCARTAARYGAAGARVAIIEDGGHSLNVERPQEVAELLRDFLC